ncbi:MAG TPA: inositol monophosphatase family protein [Gaiellaceae bacterium]
MEPDLDFAHELADAADAVTVAAFRTRDLDVTTKADSTPVSAADRGAEESIRSLVASRRSGETVFGEEHGDDGGDVRWIVDPIDGTRNYIRGIPVWATLIALEREGVVDVAVVSAPALGRRWWASRGGGAVADGDRCSVSSVARLEDAVVSTTSPPDMPRGWTALSEKALAVRGFSDFWQHCLVAEGAVDVATDYELELWDYAAIALIVAEAGGRCSTFEGDVPLPRRSFVSTNRALHDAATSLLASVAAS